MTGAPLSLLHCKTEADMAEKCALVLGATGGIGGTVARQLLERGWRVKALHRREHAPDEAGPEWLRGDAMNRADVVRAAEGVSLIVHAVNPPGYRRWGELVLPMLENTIAAARNTRARIVLPGTIYNFGPDALPEPEETSPQNPATTKGKIRAAMEARLQLAAARGEAEALIVRAGDYFGPRAGNNWFSQVAVKPGRKLRSITMPGRCGIGHQWAFLPDVAETMVRLAETGGLKDFETFHMEGHWDHDGQQMVRAIRAVLGAPDLPVRRLPWWAVRLAAPFVPFCREVAEVEYLWREPVRLTNARLVSRLGEEPRTPLEQAVRATLADLGCLDGL